MHKAQVLALLLSAAAAAPVAQFVNKAVRAPLPQTSDWPAIWAAEQASMVSVLNAMTLELPPTCAGCPMPTGGSITPAAPAPEAPQATATSVDSPPAVTSSTASPTLTPAAPTAPAPTTTASTTESEEPEQTPVQTPAATTTTTAMPVVSTTEPAPATSDAAKAHAPDAAPSASPGTSTASTSYQCFGPKDGAFPDKSKWVSFDTMWQKVTEKNIILNSCQNLGSGADTTSAQQAMIKNGIQSVAGDTGVDARFIFAIMLQESKGCVNVVTTNNGVSNPGLMQSHNGHSFVGSGQSASAQQASITQMISEGVTGTQYGSGLQQLIKKGGDEFVAARMYNSGCANTQNLNDGISSTASYVNDVANYLTGWVDGDAPKNSNCSGLTRSGSSSVCDKTDS